MPSSIDEIVEREVRRWSLERRAAEQRSRGDEPAPLITISRQLGSGGGELAAGLAVRLGCPIYGRELVDEIVRRAHVSKHLVADVDEHVPGKVETWLEAILTHELFDCDDYRAALVEVLRALSQLGPAVILGRGANFVPRAHPRLDLRIVAPLEVRICRVMCRRGVSRPRAAAAIQRSDHERREFTRRVYGADWDDPRAYDLVINTGRFSLDDALDLGLRTWRELAARPPVLHRM